MEGRRGRGGGGGGADSAPLRPGCPLAAWSVCTMTGRPEGDVYESTRPFCISPRIGWMCSCLASERADGGLDVGPAPSWRVLCTQSLPTLMLAAGMPRAPTLCSHREAQATPASGRWAFPAGATVLSERDRGRIRQGSESPGAQQGEPPGASLLAPPALTKRFYLAATPLSRGSGSSRKRGRRRKVCL